MPSGSAALTVTVYGGVAGTAADGEIGGNKILVEWDERTFLLDFGTRFAVAGRFFEEFLKPRTAVGLRDYLRMGLLPPLEGIYRADLTSHEPGLWERYRAAPGYRRLERVDALLLSHAHVDHTGAIGFLRPEIPVYTGLMTATIAKGMQDSGSTGLESEFCYLAPREPAGEGVLKSVTGVRHGRPYFVCEDTPELKQAMDTLQGFWRSVPGPKTTLTQTELGCAELGRLGVRFFRVDHSIPGSGAFALQTPIGWVVYSGDLRRHGHSKWRTEGFAEQVAALKPALFIVEGTRLDPEPATEEPTVHAAATDVVKREPGLVIADFSPRNIERLRTFHDIASAQGRRLVVTTRDAYLLQHMHVIDAKIPEPGASLAILKEPITQRGHWERDVLQRHAGSVVDAAAIQAAPGGYILCLSFFDITNLVDLDPSGGTYIYSSSEAYDEEQKIDHRRLTDWLSHFGLKVVGGLPGAEEGPFHASGHIDGAGMEWLIETIKPERILPVHTQKLDWFEQRWPRKVIRAGYGVGVAIE